jgi:hypothetical protein
MALSKLLSFLNQLEERTIYYSLSHNTSDAIMVDVALLGVRYEIEFFEDGRIEVELFESSGDIEEREPEDILKAFDAVQQESTAE